MNNDKCEFCKGTKVEPGKTECTWCDNTGLSGKEPTTLRWRADGDANTYTLLRDKDWVASLRMNGRMLVTQQETILNSFISATNGEVERLRAEVKRLDLMVAQADFNYDSDRGQFKRKLAEREALLERCVLSVEEQHCDEGEASFDLPAPLMAEINALLSASAKPENVNEQ